MAAKVANFNEKNLSKWECDEAMKVWTSVRSRINNFEFILYTKLGLAPTRVSITPLIPT